jgi:hypothetical protein
MIIVIEMGKEYRTRDGREVRLHTTTSRCNLGSVVGEYETCGQWVLETWDCGGVTIPANCNLDLIEVKPVRVYERWVNVDKGGICHSYKNPEDAAAFATTARIACLHIRQEYHEGDGLCDSEKT